MTLTKKTLAGLSCIALMGTLAACGDSTEAAPATSTAVTSEAVASEPTETESVVPEETTEVSVAPEESASAPSDPEKSDAPVATGEIPDVIHGSYVVTAAGEAPRECTEQVEGDGQTITVDATTISSFAFYFYVEELQKVTDTSIEGVFSLADDSDTPVTPMVRLETTDGWETLDLIELGTDAPPMSYARCP